MRPNFSKATQEISKYLDTNKVRYEREVTFKECRNIRVLPFDFMIYKGEDEFVLIEYDGKHHHISGGLISAKQLADTQHRDSVKTDFCAKHGINLYRIRYDQDHVQYLKRILKLNGIYQW